MIRITSILFLFCASFTMHAQLVKVTDRAEVKIKKRSKYFQHLHEDFPVDSLQYVATISGEAKKIETLYTFLRNEAHELKSNFYDMTVFTQNGGKYHIEWKLYFGSDSLTFVNYNLYPKNQILLFGHFKQEENYWINGEKLVVPKFTYHKLIVAENEVVNLQTRAISKSNNQYKGSDNNAPLYNSNIDKLIRVKPLTLPAIVGGMFGIFSVLVLYDMNGLNIIQPGDGYFLQQIFKEYIPE